MGALPSGRPGLQIDAKGYLTKGITAGPTQQSFTGSGAVQLIPSGGPNNAPYFHDLAQRNGGFDGIIFPNSFADRFFAANHSPFYMACVMRMPQAPAGLGELLTVHSNVIYTDVQYRGTHDSAFWIVQNNGRAEVVESNTSLIPTPTPWFQLEVFTDGSYWYADRDGVSTAKSANADDIGGFRVGQINKFELFNGGIGDVAICKMAPGLPSQSQRNADLAASAARYKLPAPTAVSDGPATALPPSVPDLLSDYQTAPNFPVTDHPPADPSNAGPGGGLVLEPGAASIMNLYFPGDSHPANVADEATLRKYVYLNYFSGNQTTAIGSPMDTGQSNNNTFAAVARHYPLGSAHSTTAIEPDGLHLAAYCSNNRTNCTPGAVYAGFVRFPPPIRPGMTIKLRMKSAPGKYAWTPVWMFSGEQLTPGPGGDPYANNQALFSFPKASFEIDADDHFVRFYSGQTAPYGSQIDFGAPDIYGVPWAAGHKPQLIFLPNYGRAFVAHPDAGPPFLDMPGLAPDWASAFYDLILSLRDDGTHRIDAFFGKESSGYTLVGSAYLDIDSYDSKDRAGLPEGMCLMIGNQAIPGFAPGAGSVSDNEGIPDDAHGIPAGWTSVIQEVDIWSKPVSNPSAAIPQGMTNAISVPPGAALPGKAPGAPNP